MMRIHLPKEIKNTLIKIYRLSRVKKIDLFLVGGYIRDIILKRPKDYPDIDFAVKKDAVNFARFLAKRIKAGFVVLDKEHGSCRLVKRIEDKVYTLDFSDFRDKTIKLDLMHRDFTINALAIDLERAIISQDIIKEIIDPYQGFKDLGRRVVRAVAGGSFDEDPLRILRAFSISCILGFKIEEKTLKLARIKREKLATVSFERIRDELFKILESPNAYQCVLKMDKLKILSIIIPEIEKMRGVKQGPYHHLDVLSHSFESIRQFENMVGENKNKDLNNYLNEIMSSQRKRLGLIKLGLLLHDIGKPAAKRRRGGKTIFHGHERVGLNISEEIIRRLKLSNDEQEILRKMVFLHLRPGYLADNEPVTERAKFRYFRDSGREALSVLLVSMADQRATKGPLTSRESRLQHERVCSQLIKEYFKNAKQKKMPRLVNGNDIIKAFNIAPSPIIGKILSALEEMQAIGKIKTKKEALSEASKILKRRK
jgi:putative nucleotidyltransferase with HDIG domain